MMVKELCKSRMISFFFCSPFSSYFVTNYCSRVGKDTLYGKMAIEMSLGDDRDSPLQFKLSALAETISKIGYIGATSIALSFLFKQFIMDQGWDLAQTMLYLTGSPLKALKDATSALTLGFYFTFNLTYFLK